MNFKYLVKTATKTVAGFDELDDADDFAERASRKNPGFAHLVVHAEKTETVITRAYNGKVENMILQGATRRA